MIVSQLKAISQPRKTEKPQPAPSITSSNTFIATPLTSIKDFKIIDFKVASVDSSLVSYYYSKGTEHYQKSEFFSAVHSFKRTLAYNPTHFESYINLGACYYHLHYFTEALKVYGKCIKIEPTSPIPYINKALTQLSMQDHPQVILTIDKALETLPDPPEELYKLRTLVICQTGKVTNFLEDIQKSNGFEPRKRFESRKTIPSSLEVSIKRPQTSYNRRNQNIVHLYPEATKTFFKVDELKSENKQRDSIVHSVTLSPAHTKAKKKRSASRQLVKKTTIIGRQQFDRIKGYLNEPKPQFKPGVIQINALDKEEEFQETFEAAEIFKKKVKVLKKYIAEDLAPDEDFKQSSKDSDLSFITENQIKTLMEEFRNKLKNLEKIDKIAVKLEFLQKFPLPMRESIYACAKIKTFMPGEVVFREGDPGDEMFVIIKGSVIINKRISEIRNYPLIIASLYDGRQFGDVSILSNVNEQEPRKGTCIVTEPSTMFIIPKQEYKRLLFKYLKPELEEKVNFLVTLRLFKNVELNSLYTLASNVLSKKYVLGDIILNKGEMPKGLYVITTGHVEVVTEGYAMKRAKPKIYGNAKIREKSPRPFYNGNYSPSSPQAFDFPKKPKNTKSYSVEVENKVKESMLNFTLYPSEFFGGRMILNNELFLGQYYRATPSKFSFIARSSEVNVLIILKDHMQFLDAQTEFVVKSILSKCFHIDSPEDIDADEMDDLFKKWQNYKKAMVEDIYKQRYVERNKQDYPFIR